MREEEEAVEVVEVAVVVAPVVVVGFEVAEVADSIEREADLGFFKMPFKGLRNVVVVVVVVVEAIVEGSEALSLSRDARRLVIDEG